MFGSSAHPSFGSADAGAGLFEVLPATQLEGDLFGSFTPMSSAPAPAPALVAEPAPQPQQPQQVQVYQQQQVSPQQQSGGPKFVGLNLACQSRLQNMGKYFIDLHLVTGEDGWSPNSAQEIAGLWRHLNVALQAPHYIADDVRRLIKGFACTASIERRGLHLSGHYARTSQLDMLRRVCLKALDC